MFNASVSQQNIFGSGNALIAAINTSQINRTISLAFTEPYWTVDGVSRTLEVYQRNIDTGLARRHAVHVVDAAARAIGFGVPITETDTINVGVRAERTSIEFPTLLRPDQPAAVVLPVRRATSATPFNSFIVSGGWSRDTRDDILYPTRGRLQSFGVEVGLPFGDLPYYKAATTCSSGSRRCYVSDFVLMLRADLGYADGYSGKPLPFFKAFYAGGVGSVRGYETASLGPKDIYGNALGGKRKIVGNAELFYPILKGDKSVRASVFFDVGQISGIPLVNGTLSDNLEPGYENFRYSAGVGLAWNSPIGPLKFSYGYPLNDQPRRQDPALPVPGRVGVLTPARRPTQQENPLNRSMLTFRAPPSPPLACWRWSAGAAHAADYKIGFVNTERLFREAAPAKRAQQKLEKEFAARDAEIQKLAKQVRDLQAQLEKDGATMAETERRNKERDLANLSRDLQRVQREFREDLNLRRNEELASVQERANKVIQQIAEAEKFDLILQDPVVYASQRIDITDKVIKALADK